MSAQSGVMIAELGPDFTIIYANAAYAELYGLKPSDLIGKHPRDLMSEAVFAQVGPKLESARNGVAFQYELDLRSVEAGPDFVEVSYQPDRNADGSLNRILVIVSDITDYRLSVSVAETLQARLSAAHQLSPDGFMVFGSVRDEDGHIIDFEWEYVNAAGARIAGVAIKDLIGSNMLDYLPGNKVEGLFDAYVNVVETGKIFETTRYYKHDGLDVWLEITAIKLGDGFAVSFADVTDAKLQEIELQENERRLDIALHATKLGVWDLDPHGKTSRRSLQHDEIFGYPDGIEEWSQDEFLDHIVPEDQERMSNEIETALKNKEAWHFITRLDAAGGKQKWVSIHGEPILDENGNVKRLIGTIADITEEKEADQHRELLVGELNHRVKNSLATIQAIAKQTMRAAPDMESFETSFNARLGAISAAHEIVIDTKTDRADITTLIEKQVRPYAPLNEQLIITGETVMLSSESAHNLGLVLHELATNAAKYGALSQKGGQVRITTQVDNNVDVSLHWSETGGPIVNEPDSEGFGSRLIKQSIEYSLGGTVDLEYDPNGFRAHLCFPKHFCAH